MEAGPAAIRAAGGRLLARQTVQHDGHDAEAVPRPFGPEEELDADTDGITWAYRAGYDPRALNEIYAAFEKHGFDQPDFMPSFLRSHPPSAERRQNLQATFQKLQAAEPKDKNYLGRENLARRLTKAQQEFAE